ncbi:hypothetical protein V6O07_11030 [Arthrospira platensis SPKY2]
MNQTTETTTETTISHYLCIGCPLGCRLEVEADNGHIVENYFIIISFLCYS